MQRRVAAAQPAVEMATSAQLTWMSSFEQLVRTGVPAGSAAPSAAGSSRSASDRKRASAGCRTAAIGSGSEAGTVPRVRSYEIPWASARRSAVAWAPVS